MVTGDRWIFDEGRNAFNYVQKEVNEKIQKFYDSINVDVDPWDHWKPNRDIVSYGALS